MRGHILSKILMLTFILLVIPTVFALRGEIGNAKAIINVDFEGEKQIIERTLLVRNSNDVAVDIELEPSAEIMGIIDIKEKAFTLQPNEEKDARFDIIIDEEGEWSGKIFVFFRAEGENSVVLASSLVIDAGEGDEVQPPPEEDEEILDDDTEDLDDNVEDDSDDTSPVGFGIKKYPDRTDNEGSLVGLIILIVAAIVIAAVVGFIFLLKK